MLLFRNYLSWRDLRRAGGKDREWLLEIAATVLGVISCFVNKLFPELNFEI